MCGHDIPSSCHKVRHSVAKILIYALPGQTLKEKVAYIFVQLNAWKISWNIAIIKKRRKKQHRSRVLRTWNGSLNTDPLGISDNFDNFWQLWQSWRLVTFETLTTFFDNFWQLWQSLLPDNKERHWTAFVILAMFFIGNFWTQYNHIDHTSEWFQFMWMVILFNLIPQLLHFIQNSTTLLYGFNSC